MTNDAKNQETNGDAIRASRGRPHSPQAATVAGIIFSILMIITFVVALSFLLFAAAFREARVIFPLWVFVISVYILIANRRQQPK